LRNTRDDSSPQLWWEDSSLIPAHDCPAFPLSFAHPLKSARGHICNINPHNELPAIFGAYNFVPQNRLKKIVVFGDFGF
jgi:hypothetical protein